MPSTLFLKLRSNIVVPGDVALAERECKALFQRVVAVKSLGDLHTYLPLSEEFARSNTRTSPPLGFIGIDCKVGLPKLVISLSFVQEIWFFEENVPEFRISNRVPWLRKCHTLLGTLVCAVPLMAAAELMTCLNVAEPSERDLEQIVLFLSSGAKDDHSTLSKAVHRQVTSTPHVHGLHKYKAKFFPRMIRAFIISTLGKLPASTNKMVLVDPFVGSGTALVESRLIGLKSIGVDIDILSCLISKAKLGLFHVDLTSLKSAIEETVELTKSLTDTLGETHYSFPPWIGKKFERYHLDQEREKYEQEIAKWQVAISKVANDDIQQILKVCLSDAITRKFNIRMLGTGVGRFALEIRNKDLSNIITSNFRYAIRAASIIDTIKKAYDISFEESAVYNDTATKMPLPDDCATIVLTSPPYLPGSSGRENYLISKSISITALGLMTIQEIQQVETVSIGSMKTNAEVNVSNVPDEIQKLYRWLISDELRKIKANPIVAYFKELKEALSETRRILVPNGMAIYVIGKESVFYNFRTRNILYRVPCDDVFQELAEECGFVIEERVDVELDKRNLNARPRSLDPYFETVFVLRKPQHSLVKSNQNA